MTMMMMIHYKLTLEHNRTFLKVTMWSKMKRTYIEDTQTRLVRLKTTTIIRHPNIQLIFERS